MARTGQVDDLTPEEISAIDDFYASDEGKVTFEPHEDVIKRLHDQE